MRTLSGDECEGKQLGPIFLLTDFSNERNRETVSFKGCVNRDEAMDRARLFGRPRHSSTGEVTHGRTYAAGLQRPAELRAG
jgi:hypothetical protein